MRENDALLHALAGDPIAHKDFSDPNRYIVCAETNNGLEIIDTASDTPAQWLYLVDHYGKDGWRLFEPQALRTTMTDEEGNSFIDLEYLSDQMEELSSLLGRVLDLAEARKK